MIRCKYFQKEIYICPTFKDDGIFISTTLISCKRCIMTIRNMDDCKLGKLKCYEPVELDPYWKDIVEETNRRLSSMYKHT